MTASLDAAISLFRNGGISAGVSAKMAGKPLAEVLALLSSMNIPLYGGSPKEAVDEMAAGDAWLNRYGKGCHHGNV